MKFINFIVKLVRSKIFILINLVLYEIWKFNIQSKNFNFLLLNIIELLPLIIRFY